MKDSKAVAAMHVIVVIKIVITFRRIIDVESFIMVRDIVTGVCGDGVNLFREDCQHKRDDTVASCNSLQRSSICARFGKRLFIEFITVIMTNGTLNYCVENRMDGKIKGGDAVITVDVGVEVRQRVFTGLCKSGVKSV